MRTKFNCQVKISSIKFTASDKFTEHEAAVWCKRAKGLRKCSFLKTNFFLENHTGFNNVKALSTC